MSRAVGRNSGAFDESAGHNTRRPRIHNLTDSSSTRRRLRVGCAKIDITTAGCSICDVSISTTSVEDRVLATVYNQHGREY